MNKIIFSMISSLSLDQALALIQGGAKGLRLSLSEAKELVISTIKEMAIGPFYRLPVCTGRSVRISAAKAAQDLARTRPDSAIAAIAAIAANIRSSVESTEEYDAMYGVDLSRFTGDDLLEALAEYLRQYTVITEPHGPHIVACCCATCRNHRPTGGSFNGELWPGRCQCLDREVWDHWVCDSWAKP